jgi:hypothetical protein
MWTIYDDFDTSHLAISRMRFPPAPFSNSQLASNGSASQKSPNVCVLLW